MATVYKDKCKIYLLSNNQPPGMTRVNRKTTPNVIGGYKNMGGVDKSDQHQAYYPIGHHNKKWWRYVFHSFVNL